MSERMLKVLFVLSLMGMFTGMGIAVSLVDATLTAFGFVIAAICGAFAIHASNEWYNNYYVEDED